MYDEDSQPSYKSIQRHRNSNQGARPKPGEWHNTLPKYEWHCGHVHTTLDSQLCDLVNYPLDSCKFHDNTASCRYYCRKMNNP